MMGRRSISTRAAAMPTRISATACSAASSKSSGEPYEKYVPRACWCRCDQGHARRALAGREGVPGRGDVLRGGHEGAGDGRPHRRKGPVQYGGWYLEAMDSHGGWIASAIDLVRFADGFNDPERGPILKPNMMPGCSLRPPAPSATKRMANRRRCTMPAAGGCAALRPEDEHLAHRLPRRHLDATRPPRRRAELGRALQHAQRRRQERAERPHRSPRCTRPPIRSRRAKKDLYPKR